MLFRLLIAIVLAIASLYYGILGAAMFAEGLRTDDRLEASVGFLLCGGALGGLAIARLVAFARPTQRIEEDRGPPSALNGVREIVTVLCMLLFGSFCAFVAGKAVVTGAILSLAVGKPEILLSTNPGAFLFLLVFWGGVGILLLSCVFRGKHGR
ncbi:MAG: hypothetical protein K8S22_08780 [Betaproteobacteria bacterium]|nr:hypothetical protein [Betaproteobacteria bacterium]